MTIPTLPIFWATALLLTACNNKDRHNNPCENATFPAADFTVVETLGDTAYLADTIFRNNYVRFEAAPSYDSVKWRVGNDPRTFTRNPFNLVFVEDLLTIPVNFTGYKKPVTNCFANDTGVYKGVRMLTTVEQFDRATRTLSPMIGLYQGAYTDKPTDTFTVRIEFFDSSRYSPLYFGNNSFYWISNLPKGYRDSTSSISHLYPELRQGQRAHMAYKALHFDRGGTSNAGKAWLKGDSLFAYTGNAGVGIRSFRGKRL